MKYYLAPLEGITGYIYRNAYHEMFPDFDKYFTPFIAVKQDKTLSAKEIRDIEPDHNRGMTVVPQILCNRGDDFVKTAKELQNYGYDEINLNLGCPSGTVVPKKKGAGLLGEPELLKRLLDIIFSELDMRISLKTRLGMYDAEEFDELLKLYQQYPVHELIIHARVREDYYKGTPDLAAFAKAFEKRNFETVYNGDLFTSGQISDFQKKFPQVNVVMLGRGVMANPALLRECNGGDRLKAEELRSFSGLLVQRYSQVSSGERDVLFKMKELWNFFSWNFKDPDKCLKIVRKCQRLREYEDAVRMICKNFELK